MKKLHKHSIALISTEEELRVHWTLRAVTELPRCILWSSKLVSRHSSKTCKTQLRALKQDRSYFNPMLAAVKTNIFTSLNRFYGPKSYIWVDWTLRAVAKLPCCISKEKHRVKTCKLSAESFETRLKLLQSYARCS